MGANRGVWMVKGWVEEIVMDVLSLGWGRDTRVIVDGGEEGGEIGPGLRQRGWGQFGVGPLGHCRCFSSVNN